MHIYNYFQLCFAAVQQERATDSFVLHILNALKKVLSYNIINNRQYAQKR